MDGWVSRKCGLPLLRSCEVRGRNVLLFCEGVGKERDVLPVEEVENAVVDPTFFNAELMDAILKVVSFRTP